MRAFVAVSVPPEVTEVLAALERPVFDNVRWTTPEQWHVTLRFLGEVPDIAPVRDALAAVPAMLHSAAADAIDDPTHDPTEDPDDAMFEAVMGPVTAWFPGRRVLHVPVLGLEALADATAAALADVVDSAGDAPGGGDGDHHPFIGHLTLARVRGRRPGPARLAGTPVHATWAVGSMTLMGSTLGPGGARYQTLSTLDLRA